MLRRALLGIALLCSGIGAGSAYLTLFAFDPANSTPAFWVALLQHIAKHVGIALFVVQPVASLAAITSTVLARRDRPAFWFFLAASVAMIVATLVTRFGNVPINVQIGTWSADALPASFAELQQSWWSFHVVRSAALVVGACTLILAALTTRREP